MIDPEQCDIHMKLVTSGQDRVEKAFVTIKQDGARISNFTLKYGRYGLYLDPPKFRKSDGSYFHLYFDENAQRYDRLQERVIAQYMEMIARDSATTNEIINSDELDELLRQPL